MIPSTANIDGSGKALAYAIARQESAFNPAAISTANARGLLQLMPGTAKSVASRYGLAYSQDKLTSDAGYNATLGAHYLGEQISSFAGLSLSFLKLCGVPTGMLANVPALATTRSPLTVKVISPSRT